MKDVLLFGVGISALFLGYSFGQVLARQLGLTGVLAGVVPTT